MHELKARRPATGSAHASSHSCFTGCGVRSDDWLCRSSRGRAGSSSMVVRWLLVCVAMVLWQRCSSPAGLVVGAVAARVTSLLAARFAFWREPGLPGALVVRLLLLLLLLVCGDGTP